MTDTLIQRIKDLTARFGKGWHDGIQIDASDIADLCLAADALEQQAAEIEMHCRNNAELGAEVLRQAAEIAALMADAERLRVTLRFYARGEHYNVNADEFDTVSGEPDNWLCSGLDDSETMIEDGGYARLALRGLYAAWENEDGDDETPQPIEGEVSCAALRQEQPT